MDTNRPRAPLRPIERREGRNSCASHNNSCPGGSPIPQVFTMSTSSNMSVSSPACNISLDVLCSLLGTLHPGDVANFLTTNKEFHQLDKAEPLWQTLTKTWYQNYHRDASSPSWRSFFRAQFSEFGNRYLSQYRTVRALFDDYCQFLSSSAPHILASFQPGLSESKIRTIMAESPAISVPIDYLLWMKMSDGQADMNPYELNTLTCGLLGGYRYYDTVCNCRLRTLDFTLTLAKHAFWPTNSGQKLLPFTMSRMAWLLSRGQRQGEDLVRFYLDDEGRVVRLSGKRRKVVHVIANTFTEFMRTHLERLKSGIYQINPDGSNRGIQRFPFPDPCGSSHVTEGIRVDVSVLWVPEESHTTQSSTTPNQYFFTYRIRMTHTDDTLYRTTGQLTTRHWIITDANGKVDEVKGPGVIGMHPQLFPGCPPFDYESVCPLATPTGTMRGSFQFLLAKSDRLLDVIVAPFTFDINRNYV